MFQNYKHMIQKHIFMICVSETCFEIYKFFGMCVSELQCPYSLLVFGIAIFVNNDLECNALPVRNGVRGNVLSVHVYKKYAASRHSSSGIAPIPVLTA